MKTNQSSLRKDDWNVRYNMSLESFEAPRTSRSATTESSESSPASVASGLPTLQHLMTIELLGELPN